MPPALSPRSNDDYIYSKEGEYDKTSPPPQTTGRCLPPQMRIPSLQSQKEKNRFFSMWKEIHGARRKLALAPLEMNR